MNTINISLVLSLIAVAFFLSGWTLLSLSFIFKIENYYGTKFVLIPPNAFLMIFIGSLMFSLSDIYEQKWLSFFIQFLVSCLNLSIYIIQRKTYKKRLEDEIR